MVFQQPIRSTSALQIARLDLDIHRVRTNASLSSSMRCGAVSHARSNRSSGYPVAELYCEVLAVVFGDFLRTLDGEIAGQVCSEACLRVAKLSQHTADHRTIGQAESGEPAERILGYVPPAEFEEAYYRGQQDQAMAA
jgi:hypothetical protein